MSSGFREKLQTFKTGVIDQRAESLRRLKELYRIGGVSEVYRGVRDYYRYNIKDEHYHAARTDNEQRWSFIVSNIPAESTSLVDVGCADGFFVQKAAEQGLLVHGFEGNQSRVRRAEKAVEEYEDASVEQLYISPDNIDQLPASDVVLFLTVHHHWIRQYGWETAADMFRTIARKTELIFYEPPGNKVISQDGTEETLSPSDSLNYYETELKAIFDDSISVTGQTMVEYNNTDRSDPLFVIDTTDF